MKKLIFLPTIAFAAISLFFCYSKNFAKTPVSIPEFPYQSYLDSMGEECYSPKIGFDGYGFDGISNHISYPQLPESLSKNQLADSLLLIYNFQRALSTILYDAGTANRYLEETDMIESQISSLSDVKVDGIKDESLQTALRDFAKALADTIECGNSPFGYETPVYKPVDDGLNNLFQTFIASHLPTLLEDSLPIFADHTAIIDNYDEIHQKAISDTASFRCELLQQVLSESDFMKKCILARELAYSNYISPEQDNKQLIAIIDPILREGKYSPFLMDLWVIWRATLQTNILGGISNDSSMYNILYNEMRNAIVLPIISHIISNPDDLEAYWQFLKLTLHDDINRHSGAMFGNNVIIDNMEYFYYVLHPSEE